MMSRKPPDSPLTMFCGYREVVGMLTQEWNWGKAMEVAKKEGWEDGREERAKEIARNFKAKGISVDDIAEATGLTVDDVLRL